MPQAFKMIGRAFAILALVMLGAYVYGWMSGAENLSLFSFHAGYLYVVGIGFFLGILWVCGTFLRQKEKLGEVRFPLEAGVNLLYVRMASNVVLASFAAPIACYWLSVILRAVTQQWLATQLYALRYWSTLIVFFGAVAWMMWSDKPSSHVTQRHVPPNTF